MANRFKLHRVPVAAAALITGAAPVQAGPGFVDATAPDGVTTFRLPTYFAYSPSGLRITPVPEDDSIAAMEGRVANYTGKALRKFIDPLPLPGAANARLMADGTTSKYIPVAVASKWRNPQGTLTNDDYYEIAVVEYTDRFHSDLKKATVLRGYVQIDHEASNGRTPLPGSQSVPLSYPGTRNADGTPGDNCVFDFVHLPGDMNGDGVANNDLIYIPTAAELQSTTFLSVTVNGVVYSEAAQRQLFENYINSKFRIVENLVARFFVA